MIPIYRAKKIDSDEYIEGFLKNCTDTGLDTFWIQSNEFIDYKIEINTLSIHFPDMLDIQGNKIFASLQEDGKGGDILKHINHIHQDDMPVYNPYYKKGDIKIDDIPLKSNMPNLDYYRIVGIQQ